MASWQDKLPRDILDAIQLPSEELNDFAGPITRMDILSRITFKRALEAVAREQEEPEDHWGDYVDKDKEEGRPPALPSESATEALKLTVAAHKELVRAKFIRLDAMDRFKGAQDKPEPANINFEVRLPSTTEAVQRFINMGRYEEARKVAKLHRIEHEFDWEALE